MDKGTFYGGGRSSGLYWNPPFKSDLLAGGDGTIITIGADKYLKDKVSGKNLLITGYDFDSTWTKGFPYKSAATISAPAGDAAFIAADLNNFWYTDGGIPNQIPVVSCFQDVDYEHKTFFKHAAQVLDGNGVEVYEPRVIEWAVYSTAKAGADIVTANTYYVVPVIDATAKWIDPLNGVDATGNGSQALPYKTHSKVNGLTLTEAILVYVQTGQIAPIAWSKNYQLKTLGFLKITNVASGRGIDYDPAGTLEQTIEGYVIDMNNAAAVCFNGALLHTLNLKRIYGYRQTTAAIQGTTLDNARELKIINSILIAENATTGRGVYANKKLTVDTVKIISAKWGIYKDNVGETTITIKNSKVTSSIIGRFYGITNLTALGSKFIWTTQMLEYNATPSGLLSLKKCLLSHGNAASATFLDFSPCAYSLTEIDGCTILSVRAAGINFENQTNFKFKNNINIPALATNAIIVHTQHTKDSLVGSFEIHNNILIGGVPSQGVVSIGNESGNYYNRISGTIYYNRTALINTYDSHGIFVFNQNVGTLNRWNFLANNTGFKSAAGDDYSTSVIANNVVKSGQILAKGILNLKIYNNTSFINDFDDSIGVNENIGITQNDAVNSTGCSVKNNIVIYLGNIVGWNLCRCDHATNEFDYNIYYCPNVTPTFKIAGAVKTFAEWQALGYDAHSIMLTDEQFSNLFNDYANGDYSLKSGSIAIGAGETLDAAYDDGLDALTNWGTDSQIPVVVTKQQGAAWDIGAYVH